MRKITTRSYNPFSVYQDLFALGALRRLWPTTLVLFKMSISLASIPFFANLDAGDMMALMSATKTVEVPGNTTIFWKGDAPDALYIALSGRLKVFVRDQKGRETVFATLKPGDYFGEMGIIDGEPRSANVATIEPCTLLRLGATEFDICLQTNFRIVRTVLMGLSARMRELNARNVALQR